MENKEIIATIELVQELLDCSISKNETKDLVNMAIIAGAMETSALDASIVLEHLANKLREEDEHKSWIK